MPVADMFRNVKYGLQNLWKWKRIIYVDRDWDWAFMYKILAFKLECMIRLQDKYGVCLDKNLLMADMTKAKDLLNKLADDDYPNMGTQDYYDEMHKDRKELFTLLEEKSMEWWD